MMKVWGVRGPSEEQYNEMLGSLSKKELLFERAVAQVYSIPGQTHHRALVLSYCGTVFVDRFQVGDLGSIIRDDVETEKDRVARLIERSKDRLWRLRAVSSYRLSPDDMNDITAMIDKLVGVEYAQRELASHAEQFHKLIEQGSEVIP